MYRQNNVEFRITSATAISSFKATQAHSFLQITRKEFEFSLCSREVVLLCYERISQLLLQLERDFINEELHKPSQKLTAHVFKLFMEEIEGVLKTSRNYPDVFGDVTELLDVIIDYSQQIMGSAIVTAMNANSAKAFTNITQLFSEFLQHILISMHEYNNNVVQKKNPFICVSRFSLLAKSPRFISLSSRAQFFRDLLGNQTFCLKNYTDEPLNDEVIEALATHGIVVQCEQLEMSA
jgi:hypothetical protein